MKSKSGGFPLKANCLSYYFSMKQYQIQFNRRETIELKKLIKWIVGLGTVGTAIGLLAVRLIKKSKSTSSDIKADSTDSNKEEADSDTFDLDQDLEPTQERSYVSLQAAQPDDLSE